MLLNVLGGANSFKNLKGRTFFGKIFVIAILKYVAFDICLSNYKLFSLIERSNLYGVDSQKGDCVKFFYTCNP